MARMLAVVVLAITSVTGNAAACSLVTPVVVQLQPAEGSGLAKPPEAPRVTVQGVKRGNGEDPANSCSDLGAVTFAIPADRTSRKLLYSFETVRASGEHVGIDIPPSRGIEYQGRLLFTFPWLDGAYSAQEPFEVVVRVTPYRHAGLAGTPVELVVSDNGR